MEDQIARVVRDTKAMQLYDCFRPNTAKHVYYVIGFLCHAGEKEALRRSNKKDIGKCIAALKSHFVLGTDKSAVAAIRLELSAGVTALVDKRCQLGGLKYPDKALYSVFVLIEKAFSIVATPRNFSIFGGRLLDDISKTLQKNEQLISDFSGLFDDDVFPKDTIHECMVYYLSVFGNVRARDLAFRYNSNIKKGPEVGLRQTFATAKATTKAEATVKGKKPSNKKKKGKGKRKTVKAQTGEFDGYVSSDAEPEVCPEQNTNTNDQHAALQNLSTTEVDVSSSDNRKECTIHPKTISHMD